MEKISLVSEPVLDHWGYELVEVRYVVEQGAPVLRLLVEKKGSEGGISVGDCEKISRELSTLLEVEDLLPGRCFFEVSSPGLDRPLVKESDFIRFSGKMISLKTREAIEGRRNYKGLLKGLEEGNILMSIDNRDYRVPLTLIDRAHLVY